MGKSTSWYPSLTVDGDGSGVVSQARAVTLLATAQKVGLDRALSLWRKPLSTHDPGNVVLDLAVGGDCVADLAVLRSEPGVFGRVASDPTVSRLVAVLAKDAPKVLAAIARAHAPPERRRGNRPANMRPITASTPRIRWSSI
ncbi:transposase [Nocardia sp. CA-135953]|uniref:transposase n=1 Tax=Nocardia sp. CA-135953 TaxID=3239978 RepID=UPI003D96EE00